MKEMINRLSGAFLVAALIVMPLCGMQLEVVREAVNNVDLLNEIVDQAHKTIDVALGTFSKQQVGAEFEVAKAELVRLMEKIDIAAIDLHKIDLEVRKKFDQLTKKIDFKTKIKLAPLMEKVDSKIKAKLDQLMKIINLDGKAKQSTSDAVVVAMPLPGMEVAKKVALEISLLDQIVDQAKNILEGPFELRADAKKELARLMNDENLDIRTKFAMSDDIEIIQQVAGKGIFQNAHDAYVHLQSVIADRKAELGVAPQGIMQRMHNYVSRKFQEVKRAVSTLWYGKANKE
jgi:hypothetical protein